MRPPAIRPGSGAGLIILELYCGEIPGSALAARIGLPAGAAYTYLARLRRRGLVAGRPPRLSETGRWVGVSLRLGVGFGELVALAVIASQLDAETGFAVRYYTPLRNLGYGEAAIRDIYNRLVAGGWIYRISNGGIVGMTDAALQRIGPYREQLRGICVALRRRPGMASV